MKKLLIVCSVLLVLALLIPLMGAATTKSLVIEVSEDAYIMADLLDAEDSYGYRDTNYGSEDVVATWYLWSFEEQEAPVEEEEAAEEEGAEGEETEGEGEETEGEEEETEAETETVMVETGKAVSIIYLKFDLAQLEDKDIESAMLQLYPTSLSILEPRYVQAYLVSSEWEEATLTYNTAPAWGNTAIATTTIYQAEQWYGWDITGSTVDAGEEGQISLAILLRDMTENSQEAAVFPSRESGENAARLLVTYTESGFAWYWWVIGGVALLALLAAAFFVGMKLMQRRQPAAK